jgi:hypothetical protein
MQSAVKSLRTIESYWLLSVLLLAMAFSGCVSYTTLQSPKVMEPGQWAIGAGCAATTEDVGEFSLYGRMGVVRHLDVGLKLFDFAPSLGVFGDVKYQMWEKAPFLSGDLGFSHMSSPNLFGSDDSDDLECFALYPMLLFGSEQLYAGAKVVYFSQEVEFLDLVDKTTISDHFFILTLGGSFGDEHIRVMPEFDIGVWSMKETATWGGLAIQHVSK